MENTNDLLLIRGKFRSKNSGWIIGLHWWNLFYMQRDPPGSE